MALGEDDRAMSDFNQAATLNKSKDLFTLVRIGISLTAASFCVPKMIISVLELARAVERLHPHAVSSSLALITKTWGMGGPCLKQARCARRARPKARARARALCAFLYTGRSPLNLPNVTI